ncbi:unnamed protein product [Pleuronectes platessa]|uniref:Uncharacterized protein n=1 Tax=Pleuronectes platessa TaxID=8262 RepID=A0A9N7TYX9_PLEPL|nr:unnamed protein product [Pleuronectes platessa]
MEFQYSAVYPGFFLLGEGDEGSHGRGGGSRGMKREEVAERGSGSHREEGDSLHSCDKKTHSAWNDGTWVVRSCWPDLSHRLITAALRRRYRARCEPPSAGALGISAHASLRRRFRVRCEPGVTALERRLVQRRRNWKVLLRMR